MAMPTSALQRIDDQSAEQLRVEEGALGRHPFAGIGDRANVFDRGGHHQGGQFETAAAAFLPGEVATRGIAFAEAFTSKERAR